MEEDPFGSLVRQCQPTSSQEDRLRTCPFAREDEVFPEDESPSTSVEPTGIVMVSLPDSSKADSSPHEDFRTPPEDSLLESSEEQRKTTAGDALAGQKINGVSDKNDSAAMAVYSCTGTDKTVDLGKDSDNLGFSGVKSTQLIGGGGAVSGVPCSGGVDAVNVSEVSEDELTKYSALRGELNEGHSFEPRPKKLKVSEKNSGLESPNVCLGNNEPVIVETNRNENAGTEVLESEFEEIAEGLGFGEDTMNVGPQLKETEESMGLRKADQLSKNGEGFSVKKNIEDLEKFKYVSSGGINRHGGEDKGFGGRRELPSSISGQAKNVGKESGLGSSSAKHQLLKDLLDALKMAAKKLDDGSEDVDFFETAKRRGMTFPRPRLHMPLFCCCLVLLSNYLSAR
ncbi:hypothetical protein F0562_007894 [Nyssa sinensis]|uniref:Uncharacterized protein n=1 Tax=Nyssa sinensis TaxID=561372 RepID=A0A5J5A861_9ASTE|nr:hypothetical protein F0562_007894 [Nyssa sinensis]